MRPQPKRAARHDGRRRRVAGAAECRRRERGGGGGRRAAIGGGATAAALGLPLLLRQIDDILEAPARARSQQQQRVVKVLGQRHHVDRRRHRRHKVQRQSCEASVRCHALPRIGRRVGVGLVRKAERVRHGLAHEPPVGQQPRRGAAAARATRRGEARGFGRRRARPATRRPRSSEHRTKVASSSWREALWLRQRHENRKSRAHVWPWHVPPSRLRDREHGVPERCGTENCSMAERKRIGGQRAEVSSSPPATVSRYAAGARHVVPFGFAFTKASMHATSRAAPAGARGRAASSSRRPWRQRTRRRRAVAAAPSGRAT